MTKQVQKLVDLLNYYDNIVNQKMDQIEQIFIDFVENQQSDLLGLIDKDYSEYFIMNDFIGSMEYDIENIIQISKEELYTTELFKELKTKLNELKNGEK